jgi:Arc/MetJ-type ribon-helix-helix transcriptional regulator
VKKTITIAIDETLLAAIDQWTKAQGPAPSRSATVEHAVRLWLQQQLKKS